MNGCSAKALKTENKDGAVLKYRIICSKLSLAPAPLADYVVEETKKYFSIEFDENNADKIPELFLEAVTNEDNRKYIQKSIHYGLGCISEKGNIFRNRFFACFQILQHKPLQVLTVNDDCGIGDRITVQLFHFL